MEKIFKQNNGLCSLSCDKDHVLHDTREPEVREIRRITVKASDVEYWEELPAGEVAAHTKAEYRAKVASMVRERYPESKEFAIQREMINALLPPGALLSAGAEASADTAGGAVMAMDAAAAEKAVAEFAEYNAFVERCKAEAPAALALDKRRQQEEAQDTEQ